MDITEVERICAEQGLHTIECSFPDAQGVPRGKRIPTAHFLKTAHRGFELANAALVWGRHNDVIQDTVYTNFGTGYPDMIAVPDLSTFRPVPWRPGAASVICDCREHDGREVAVSTRHVLKQVVAEARRMGYEPQIGPELEFYVLDQAGAPVYPGTDCYSLTRGATLEPLLGRVRESLGQMGIEVEACNTEYGPAQVEINIHYSDALEAADNTMRFKMAVKEIACDLGYRVTFMAKPFAGESGSGFHVHQSLNGSESGANAFGGSSPDGLDGDLMGQYLAGVLAHMVAINALGSSTINAYKRVDDHTFAPTQVCWGMDNRTVGVRAIAGQGPANRLEWRGGAADANPYLAIAGSLAAGLDGVRLGLRPPARVEGDAYARAELAPLPTTLEAGLDAIEHDCFAERTLGAFLQVFVALGRHELSLWRSAVTDWEQARYMDD